MENGLLVRSFSFLCMMHETTIMLYFSHVL